MFILFFNTFTTSFACNTFFKLTRVTYVHIGINFDMAIFKYSGHIMLKNINWRLIFCSMLSCFSMYLLSWCLTPKCCINLKKDPVRNLNWYNMFLIIILWIFYFIFDENYIIAQNCFLSCGNIENCFTLTISIGRMSLRTLLISCLLSPYFIL